MNAPTAAIPAAPLAASNGIDGISSPPIPSTGCPAAASTIACKPSLIQIIDRRLRSCRQNRPGNEQVRGLSCSHRCRCVNRAADHEAGGRNSAHFAREGPSVLSGERPTPSRRARHRLGRSPEPASRCPSTRRIRSTDQRGQLGRFEIGFPHLDEIDACRGGRVRPAREGSSSQSSGRAPMAAPSRRRSVTRHKIIADCGSRIADRSRRPSDFRDPKRSASSPSAAQTLTRPRPVIAPRV